MYVCVKEIGMAGPTDLEQLLLEYVNDTRLDPMGDAARYISSYAPLASPNADIAGAMRYFGVSGPALQSAYQALTPVQPVAWNEALATSARGHDQVMIDTQTQTHQAPGEADLGARANQAGYTGWSALGENVYAYATSPIQAHAGFMVDWGPGADGMQSPAGHRVNLMNGSYREVGIGILSETDSATPVGPLVVTEDFGVRSAATAYILGVAYTDRDHNDFYGIGEGRSDLQVAIGGTSGTSVTSGASGGYQLATSTGAHTVTLTGGGLAGAVTVQLAATSDNVKIDVVGGTELKISGSATISGPVGIVEGTKASGVALTLTGNDAHSLIGTAGADRLTGGDGGDMIQGGAGSDTLLGGAGNDHLYGRAAAGGADGADSLIGGDGNDYLQGNAGADTLDGGAGSDRMFGGADGDLIRGGGGNDTINGNTGDDTIAGGDDNDAIKGGQGNDLLAGDAGNDMLSGDLGDDTLAGGAGIDWLTGGSGADTFRFAGHDAAFATSGGSAWTSDTITDFVHGTDRLALGFGIASVLTGSAQADMAAADSHAATLLAGHAGSVAAIGVGADTYLFYASSGGAVVDSAIRLAGLAPSSLAAADFI